MPESTRKRVLAYLTWSSPGLRHGIRAFAREANWLLVFPHFPSGPPAGWHAPEQFDGVLLLVGEHNLFDARQTFSRARIVDMRGTEGIDSDARVVIDHALVGAMAADYLHGLGYRRFVGISLRKDWLPNVRLDAFDRRLRERGCDPHRLYADFWMPDPKELTATVARTIGETGAPLAVYSPEDEMADVFLQAVVELGHRVPEDVAVLGTNNGRDFCETCPVPLSSVDVHLSRLGFESARLLDRMMAGETDLPKFVAIPPLRVEKRRSTERPGSDDPVVNAIQAYIAEHFAEKISAELVLQDVHASRSSAYQRFRRATGRSIGKEIEMVRLNHASSLLVDTDFKIDAVARLSGYVNTSAFCRAFKQALRRTPSEVRESGRADTL